MPLHKPLLCRNVVRQPSWGGLSALFLAVSQTGEPGNSWWVRGGVPSTGGACGPGTALSLCPVDASPSPHPGALSAQPSTPGLTRGTQAAGVWWDEQRGGGGRPSADPEEPGQGPVAHLHFSQTGKDEGVGRRTGGEPQVLVESGSHLAFRPHPFLLSPGAPWYASQDGWVLPSNGIPVRMWCLVGP